MHDIRPFPTTIRVLGLAAGLTLAGAPAPAHGAIITISDVALDGSQVVPPVLDAGHGLASVTIDTDTRAVSITGTYASMSSQVIAAHLHGPADPGEDSPLIIFPLTHDAGLGGTFSGGRTLSLAQFDALMGSRTYINVHTASHPAGEIRGQIFVPSPAGSFAIAIAGLTAIRRRHRA
tara:strand:+ start:18770 stop:19300 length:531 start_codon:yes stop_codon:yes gene_type:complete